MSQARRTLKRAQEELAHIQQMCRQQRELIAEQRELLRRFSAPALLTSNSNQALGDAQAHHTDEEAHAGE